MSALAPRLSPMPVARVLAILCFALVGRASAQDLLVSDLAGTDLATNTPWAATSVLAPNLSFGGWDFGPGAFPRAGIDDALALTVAAGATTDSTLAEAIASDQYLTFTLTPTTGTLDLSGKKILLSIARIDWHSPMRYALFTSVDGFADGSELFATPPTTKGDLVDAQHAFIVPLSGYDGLTGPVEFRLYAYEALFANHATTLTSFAILEPAPLHTLTLTTVGNGTVVSVPPGRLHEEGSTVQLTVTPDPGFRFRGWSGDLSGTGTPRFMTVDSDKTIAALFEPTQMACMEVGTNLGGLVDWTTAWVFVDVFKLSRQWLTRSVGGSEWESLRQAELPRDADGWPTALPFTSPSDGLDHYVHTLVPAPVAGDYTVIVEGTGELDFSGAATSPRLTPGGGTNTYTLTVPPGNEGSTLFVRMFASAGADPLRNLRVIMPGFETSYATQPFHPLYLSRLGAFSNLRFMDWGGTNASPLVNWSQRTTGTSYTQTGPMGAALEYMVELANTLGQDPWFSIPHQADDDYVRRAARLLRDTVAPGLRIWVEYSNETWNTAASFSQTVYVQDQGVALGLDPDRWLAGQRYVALRSARVWEIFEEEFGSGDRLVKVLGTQSSFLGITTMRITALTDPAINPAATMPDALAIAPYFGRNYTPSDLPPTAPAYPTVDEIVDVVAPASITGLQSQLQAQRLVADTQGMQLVGYEGGQHFVGIFGAEGDNTLTGLLQDANRDPRMADRYLEYLDLLQLEGVEFFSNFSYVEGWSQWGSWTLLEYQDQPLSEAPKYSAMIDWIDTSAYDVLRHGMRDPTEARASHLPLTVPRDLWGRECLSPIRFVGDAAAASEALILYTVPDATLVAPVREGDDVLLYFSP